MAYILFTDDEAAYLLKHKRIIFRRPIKVRRWDGTYPVPTEAIYRGISGGAYCWDTKDKEYLVAPPYRPGTVVKIREPWQKISAYDCSGEKRTGYRYKADGTIYWPDGGDVEADVADITAPWEVAIHMPTAAVRLCARCTAMDVAHIQDVTEAQARQEGYADLNAFRVAWDEKHGKLIQIRRRNVLEHYECYPWKASNDSICHRQNYPLLIYVNPWCWVCTLELEE